MAYAQVYPNFNTWHDTDGTPLNNGYVYIGTAGLDPVSNPISIYYDQALTNPASQPLRTTNGYIANNGSPAPIFINSTVLSYSLTVKNNAGTTIFTNLNVNQVLVNKGTLEAGTDLYFGTSDAGSPNDRINFISDIYRLYASGSTDNATVIVGSVNVNAVVIAVSATLAGVSLRDAALFNTGTLSDARLPSTITKNINNTDTDSDTITANTSLTCDGTTDLNGSVDVDGNISSSQGQVASAWCLFNGTSTPSITDSYNIASITDNGTGNYTLNFDTDLPNANYAVSVQTRSTNFGYVSAQTVSDITILTTDYGTNPADLDGVSVIIFCKQ